MAAQAVKTWRPWCETSIHEARRPGGSYLSLNSMTTSLMVTGVMGFGPIPTFVPPFVPVGPVVMGSVIPMPGVLK